MTQEAKKGSGNGMPVRTRDKLAARFCIFPKVKSADSGAGYVPVYLNVYDLTPANGYMIWAGLGIFHAGVEVHGVEYAFGAQELPTSGVFEVEPRQCPGFKFRKAIFMGVTSLEPSDLREFMEQQSFNYYGDTYHLITKNCNHFCDDICYKLTGKKIPKWVNRLARIGLVCHCILPENLKATTVTDDPQLEVCRCEKKHLRTFSCFSSFAVPRKDDISSTYRHTHYSGSLPSWESRRTRPRFIEEDH